MFTETTCVCVCDAFSVRVLIGYVLVEQYTIVRIGLYTHTLYILLIFLKKIMLFSS